eukprot:GHVU01034816.1.p4 GENE.GHVU01034816.1~~GHVU01034816.1.p4  ORF type:complete len:108 (+),score=12.09 GHVU01034816.1:2728-3051(+)
MATVVTPGGPKPKGGAGVGMTFALPGQAVAEEGLGDRRSDIFNFSSQHSVGATGNGETSSDEEGRDAAASTKTIIANAGGVIAMSPVHPFSPGLHSNKTRVRNRFIH